MVAAPLPSALRGVGQEEELVHHDVLVDDLVNQGADGGALAEFIGQIMNGTNGQHIVSVARSAALLQPKVMVTASKFVT